MKSKRNVVLNIVIVILTIILFISTCILVSETSPRSDGLYKPETAETMIRMLERGRYIDLVQSMRRNEMMGIKAEDNDAYTVPYAAADYYEAVFYYNGLQAAGDKDGAAAYVDKMTDAKQALGKYEYIADDIDAFLKR